MHWFPKFNVAQLTKPNYSNSMPLDPKIKKILKTIGRAIAALIVIVLALTFIPMIPSHDAILIKNAEFSTTDFKTIEPDFSEKAKAGLTYQVQLHRIKQGSGLIFALRKFRHSPPMVHDADEFEKLTIWIPNLQERIIPFGDRNKIVGYFTKGGSAWPQNTCSSEITTGQLEILSAEGEHPKIRIKTQFECTRRNGGVAKKIEIDQGYALSELPFAEITPWIGKQSEQIFSETYR